MEDSVNYVRQLRGEETKADMNDDDQKDTNGNDRRTTRSKRQKPVLLEIPMCPVFTPTMQEFTKYTFMEYLAAAEEMLGPKIGVYKVVSPNGWTPRNASYDDYDTKIEAPIE
jgi:hypothetical protein